MRVRLISYTPSGAILERLREEGLKIDTWELLKHLSYTFAVEGVSRACTHQLVRHRAASYCQQSQRYVEVSDLLSHVVEPDAVASTPEAHRQFIEAVSRCMEAYSRMVEAGVPFEDARFILPNAAETNILVTMTGRSLYHFFGLRCCNRAQWEIRRLADAMLVEVRRVEPELFRKAGPYCFQKGYCEEGRFSCGRMEEAAEKYRRLGYEEAG